MIISIALGIVLAVLILANLESIFSVAIIGIGIFLILLLVGGGFALIQSTLKSDESTYWILGFFGFGSAIYYSLKSIHKQRK